MKNENFLLTDRTQNLRYDELMTLMSNYYRLLHENPVQQWPVNCTIVEAIDTLKRNATRTIGPYQNLSLFEALNRMASDLVIMHGLKGLIDHGQEPPNALMTLCLGNDNSAPGDFEINGKHGEAFNVAASFFYGKMRMTRNKWDKRGHELSYIFYNGELDDNEIVVKKLTNMASKSNTTLIGVRSWNMGMQEKELINIREVETA